MRSQEDGRQGGEERTVYLQAANHPCEHPKHSADDAPGEDPCTSELRPCHCQADRNDCRTEDDAPANLPRQPRSPRQRREWSVLHIEEPPEVDACFVQLGHVSVSTAET